MVNKTENMTVNKTAEAPTQRTALDVIASSATVPTRRVHLAVCPLPGEEWSSEDIEVHQLQHAASRCADKRAGKGRKLIRQQGLERVTEVCREIEEEVEEVKEAEVEVEEEGHVEVEKGEERWEPEEGKSREIK